MNSGWVVVSQRLFDDGAESMLVPAVANFHKKTKIQRVFCACADIKGRILVSHKAGTRSASPGKPRSSPEL